MVHIGNTSDADAVTGGDTYTAINGANDGERLFTLKAGEFAWFPFDFTGDLYCSATVSMANDLPFTKLSIHQKRKLDMYSPLNYPLRIKAEQFSILQFMG